MDTNENTTSKKRKRTTDKDEDEDESKEHEERLPETFKKRKGTTNEGRDYEEHFIGYLGVLLTLNSNIETFTLSSNDENFGDFDDVVAEIQSKDNNIIKYALQLKHKNSNGKPLRTESFLAPNGDFALKKYLKSFQTLKNEYNLILYTNCNFISDINKNKTFNLSEHQKIAVKIVKSDPNELLNTEQNKTTAGQNDKNTKSCFKFEVVKDMRYIPFTEQVEEYCKFFEKFTVYTNQASATQLFDILSKQIISEFECDESIPEKYVKFITGWSKNEEEKNKLNNQLLRNILTLCLLSPNIQSWNFGSVDDNMKTLQKVINTFDLTLFSSKSLQMVVNIFGDAKDELEDSKCVEFVNDLSRTYQMPYEKNDTDYSKLLWVMNKAPLIVNENQQVYKTIKFCKGRKFILVGDRIQTMGEMKTFQTLADVEIHSDVFPMMIESFGYALAVNRKISFADFIEYNEQAKHVITTNEIVESASYPYLFQDEETLSPFYIPRSLTRNYIDRKYLEKEVDHATLVLISNLKDSKNKKYFEHYNDISYSLKTNSSQGETDDLNYFKQNIYVSQNNLTHQDFIKFCEKHKDLEHYHHFRIHNGRLQWIESMGSTTNLQKYCQRDDFEPEKDICGAFPENLINVIVGEPGIGKTELLKSFKNQFFQIISTVIVTPKNLTEYTAKEEPHTAQGFKDFLIQEKYGNYREAHQKLIKLLFDKQKPIYIWDAVDEIVLEEDKAKVFKFISEFQKEGLIQWIASRMYLKDQLENKFAVLSRQIRKLDNQQQNQYMEQKLSNINSGIRTKIEKNLNSFNSKSKEMLGIPLQLYMLTEVIVRNPEKYSKMEEGFSVADLYKDFVEDRFNFFYKRKGKFDMANHIQKTACKLLTDYIYKNYQNIALRVIFNYEFVKIKKIDLEEKIQNIQKGGDPIGFIVHVSKEHIPEFLHQSYAEYFVACYLERNYEKIPNFKEIISEEKNKNIRYIFDLLLAKTSKPHRAVLCGNWEELLKYDNLEECYDSGKRSVSHILCSWGTSYPLLDVKNSNDDIYVVNDSTMISVEKENDKYINILTTYVLEKCDLEENDELYHLNCFEYAKQFSCLITLAFIVTKRHNYFNQMSSNLICNIFYYSIKFEFEDVILCMVQLGQFYNIQTANGETALYLASQHGLSDVVSLFIEKGAQVNAVDNSNRTPLYAASSNGHYFVCEKLIQSEAEVNNPDHSGSTALFAASEKGYEDIVSLLLKSGAKVNDTNKYDSTALHLASLNGHYQVSEKLIKSGATVGTPDNVGWTAIHNASQKGHTNVVQLLIDSGAGVDALNNYGSTPLKLAAYNGRYDVCKVLISHGAKIDIPDNEGCTAIDSASEKGYSDIVDLLIKSGAKPDTVNGNGWTPLTLASFYGHSKVCEVLKSTADVNIPNRERRTALLLASEQGHKDIVTLLIDSGAKIDNDHNSPLLFASSSGHSDVCEELIKRGAGVDASNNENKTSLHLASEKGYIYVVELLLRLGAKIDATEKYGWTPLKLAALHGNYDVCVKLLESMAKTDICDSEGRMAIHSAAYKGHIKIVALLIKFGAKVDSLCKHKITPLHWAAQHGHYDVCDLLIKNGASVNIFDDKQWTAIHSAARNGHDKIVKLLIDSGAPKNVKNFINYTPLHVAAYDGRFNVCELLIASGADISIPDDRGWSPLHSASCLGHSEIVELLLQNGSNVNEADEDGVTPLILAATRREEKVVEILLKFRANPDVVDKRGMSALGSAYYNKYEKIFQMLIEDGADETIISRSNPPLYVYCLLGDEWSIRKNMGAGAEVNVYAPNGWTPLHAACSKGYKSIVATLLSAGANVTATTPDGKTPGELARENGYQEIFQITSLYENTNK